jgi:hypothetical protein
MESLPRVKKNFLRKIAIKCDVEKTKAHRALFRKKNGAEVSAMGILRSLIEIAV